MELSLGFGHSREHITWVSFITLRTCFFFWMVGKLPYNSKDYSCFLGSFFFIFLKIFYYFLCKNAPCTLSLKVK